MEHISKLYISNNNSWSKKEKEKESLIWCSDAEFEIRLQSLSLSAVLDLVQELQSAMVIEQQSFDLIKQELSETCVKLRADELSTALCSCQARLAQLCARNMKCFVQAMQEKEKEKEYEKSGRSSDTATTTEGEEEEGSEEGSASSGFHSLPRTSTSTVASQSASTSISVDQILFSVKKLRSNHQDIMVKTALEPPSSPLYENVTINSSNTIYENIKSSNKVSNSDTHIYDKPQIHGKNLEEEDDDDEVVYENVHFNTGKKSSDEEISDEDNVYENLNSSKLKEGKKIDEVNNYDIPKNSSPIYSTVNKNSESLLPQSTRMLLKTTIAPVVTQDQQEDDSESEPDIPSPDYGSEEEGEFEMPELNNDSDSRGFYAEDQGLAVILEEPEDEENSASEYTSESSSRPHSSNDTAIPVDITSAAVAAEQERILENYRESVRNRSLRNKIVETKIPSVRDIRSQFEARNNDMSKTNGSLKNEESVKVEKNNGLLTANGLFTNGTAAIQDDTDEIDYVEPIINQFTNQDDEIAKPRPTTRAWDPANLLQKLYTLQEPLQSARTSTKCVTIEGYLEKLPSGKKKATFWNAWKRRYFRAKDGYLYCYQHNQSEKPSMTMQLMGGKVDSLETTLLGVEDRQPVISTMLGIDDGKGHYVVVRCGTKQEIERWRLALMTHIAESIQSTYVHPWPIPQDPALIKDTIIIDFGSSSIRAGILCTQPLLPHLFFPTVMAVDRATKKKVFGFDAFKPEIRSSSVLHYPLRPTAKITKYSIDVNAIVGFLRKIFQDLNVEQKDYDVILSVPRKFDCNTQAKIVNELFDTFEVRAVNMTHQSVLALYAYNTTSGIVVDIGERIDIIPINDGYIVENGVSRIPYGGHQIIDHLRNFLIQKQCSFATTVESYIIRYILENLCYCSENYKNDYYKCRENSQEFQRTISIKEFFDDPQSTYRSVTLDSGCFQSTEGLFTPEAWGLDNEGIHKLVHHAIQECSMDVRKEMARSIYLSGGVTMLPGFAERLHNEIDKLTPAALVPRVHASPYRYHASYLGACVLANSPDVNQIKITQQEWHKYGKNNLKKFNL